MSLSAFREATRRAQMHRDARDATRRGELARESGGNLVDDAKYRPIGQRALPSFTSQTRDHGERGARLPHAVVDGAHQQVRRSGCPARAKSVCQKYASASRRASLRSSSKRTRARDRTNRGPTRRRRRGATAAPRASSDAPPARARLRDQKCSASVRASFDPFPESYFGRDAVTDGVDPNPGERGVRGVANEIAGGSDTRHHPRAATSRSGRRAPAARAGANARRAPSTPRRSSRREREHALAPERFAEDACRAEKSARPASSDPCASRPSRPPAGSAVAPFGDRAHEPSR